MIEVGPNPGFEHYAGVEMLGREFDPLLPPGAQGQHDLTEVSTRFGGGVDAAPAGRIGLDVDHPCAIQVVEPG